MIKKLIITVVMLILGLTPTVLADAAYPTYITDGDFLEVKYDVKTTEVEIGSEFVCEVTITNLSNKKINIWKIYLSGLNTLINSDDEVYDQLGAYETITIEIKYGVEDKIHDVYKDGENFYIDFQPSVKFRFADTDLLTAYYEYCDKITPIKITNLNDGSDYIEFEWLDDRQTFYYFYEKVLDIGSAKGEKVYKEGEVEYSYRYKNISDIKLLNLNPGEEVVELDYFDREDLDDKIGDSIKYTLSRIFEIDGEFFCITNSRVYSVGFLETPEINLECNLISTDNENNSKVYEFIITNVSSTPLDNFCFVTSSDGIMGDNEYIKFGTLGVDDVWRMECTFYQNNKFYNIAPGYCLEGILYLWRIDFDYPIEDNMVLEPVTRYWYPSVWDYDWYSKKVEETTTPIEMTPNSSIIITETPASSEIQATEIPIETQQASVTVKKRYNGFLLSFIAIGVLIVGAIVIILLSLKKIIKGNKMGKK